MDVKTAAEEKIKNMLIIAYSARYEAGHHDTVEGTFGSTGRPQDHDEMSAEWLAEADEDGTLERDVNI